MDLVEADDAARTAVMVALGEIRGRLDEIEPAALADEPDAVHRLRTTVRRLRSVLAAYGPLFDAPAVEEVRRRYRKLGRRLGRVRDLEVRLQVAESGLHDAVESGTFDPVALARIRAGIAAEAGASHRLAHERFVEHEQHPGAARRRAVLDDLLAGAPATLLAGGAVRPVLAALLAREARRTVGHASGVDASRTPAQLHAVRRAGRRLRYAAEALSEDPVEILGEPARRLAAAGETIQDVLGDHRDHVLFARYLRRSASDVAELRHDRDVLEQLAVDADLRAAARVAELEPAVQELRRAEREWRSR
ncbi:hypothetical protein ASE14_00120 [Agromyces sp. Root81]|uniref:CHAD domain-containing protein n=1 Tax=Agromyces sp. Root81 TaxID=1736601 RepID=UPI0006F42FEE|nr:CHAD domain-containing protein [Agromyces sp. Root81]KRC62301.1 hypothetical protein ASE14_00120 [Agromyces sp. Root81]